MTYVLVIIIVILIAALPITWKAAIDRKTKDDAAKIGTAEEKARVIIDDALKTAETKKREALLEVKEQSLAAKNEVDREIKDRRAEISKQERRIQSKEDTLDRKMDAMEKRESDFASKEAELKKKQKQVDELHEDAEKELERIAGMTTDEAKVFLYNKVQDDVKVDVAKLYRELVEKAKDDAGKKAKEIVVNSIQRCAVDHVSETTISVVQLPNDEMKGRIIGREGRNIRTIETMTGVDLMRSPGSRLKSSSSTDESILPELRKWSRRRARKWKHACVKTVRPPLLRSVCTIFIRSSSLIPGFPAMAFDTVTALVPTSRAISRIVGFFIWRFLFFGSVIGTGMPCLRFRPAGTASARFSPLELPS